MRSYTKITTLTLANDLTISRVFLLYFGLVFPLVSAKEQQKFKQKVLSVVHEYNEDLTGVGEHKMAVLEELGPW